MPLMIALGRAEQATTEGLNTGWNYNAMDERRAGGLLGTYRLGDAGAIDVFHMIVALNDLSDMEAITGVHGVYNVTEKTAVEALIALINGGANAGTTGHESMIWTIGGGVGSNGEFVEGLNLFAQIYANFGDYGYDAGADEDVDASGLMFDIGADYTFVNVAWKPMVGVEFLLVTGNEADTTEDDYEGFVSYEDNDDLIVLEDNEFGFDVDQNYQVIKIRGGITGELAGSVKDNFSLEVLVGIAKLDEEIATVTGDEDGLGNEVDIKASWMANKNVKLYGGIGMLFGSDVMEEVLSPATGTSEDYDSAFTYFLGTNVTF
jgi:hypothetical protein